MKVRMIAGRGAKINRLTHYARVHSSTMAHIDTRCQDRRMPGTYTDFSMGEVATRAKLATRGLGYSWGIAEDAGRAVSWLEQRDLPGLNLLARLCQRIDERLGQAPTSTAIEAGFCPEMLSATWTARDGQLCPLLSGIALSDRGLPESEQPTISAKNVMYPLLVLPFLADLADRSNYVIDLQFGSSQMSVDGVHLWVAASSKTESASLLTATEDLVISIKPAGETPHYEVWQKRRSRGLVANTVWSVLDQFAHRTYAPATEESRIRGAGAGISDND